MLNVAKHTADRYTGTVDAPCSLQACKYWVQTSALGASFAERKESRLQAKRAVWVLMCWVLMLHHQLHGYMDGCMDACMILRQDIVIDPRTSRNAA